MSGLEQLLAELISGDDQRAEAAAKDIHKYGRAAITRLGDLLGHDDPDHRWWAVRALAEFQAENITPFLITALQDEDQGIRHCSLLAMRNHPDSSAISHLIPHLADPDRLLAHLAADALIAIGKDSVPQLLEVLVGGDRSAQVEATRALAMIADYAAVSALFKLLDSDSALLEYWANEGLTKMGIGMSFFEPG